MDYYLKMRSNFYYRKTSFNLLLKLHYAITKMVTWFFNKQAYQTLISVLYFFYNLKKENFKIKAT